MDFARCMYMVENVIVPKFFFEQTEDLVVNLMNDDELLMSFVDKAVEDTDFTNPYKPEDFKVSVNKIANQIYMIIIDYPEPEREPLCYSCVLIFDEGFKHRRLFSLEKGDSEAGRVPHICEWTPDRETGELTHVNFGMGVDDYDENIRKCIRLFLDEYVKTKMN